MTDPVTLVTLNAGRGVDSRTFTNRLRYVLSSLPGDRQIIGLQEIDEADTPPEHQILKGLLGGAHRVGWGTREPIAVIGLPAPAERVTPAARGLAHWTPDRSITEAVIDVGPGPVAVLNYHPPINRPQTLSRRVTMRRAIKKRVRYHLAQGRTVILTADENATHPPRTHRMERSLVAKGLDHIRCVQAPGGVKVRLIRTGTIHTGIDAHNAQYAVVQFT